MKKEINQSKFIAQKLNMFSVLLQGNDIRIFESLKITALLRVI